ncbi:hypothetical protein AO1008_11709 [Aspergillus oryzae 100-8]|uniref:Tetraspanin Tsp3 n=1 Tax=Aspergillus oryzae (strain 3.042) TaxID=1160506 RepID=I8TKN6_ASPO3|nr:hypothetical protein Ao3042_09246 [Aspergillus oryzae 3.042]KDE75371.1 hypothetical protein AO1008_11709 [Aspergillus oryzae 100-8]|eukprot:EIT74655.1 hypothetical protein Ao3042_09246 [Aspergillus oryzae 3.042]
MSQIRLTGAIWSPVDGQTPKSIPESAGRQTYPTSGALEPRGELHPDLSRDDSLSSISDVTRLLSCDDLASVPLNSDAYYTVSTPCSLHVVNIITFHVQFSHELYRFFMYRLLKHFLRSEMDTLRTFFDWIWPIDTQHRPLQPVQEPMRLETPQICLGHLFSKDIYGDDVDIPLYYFNIVQGRDNAVKVIITTSKAGAAGAAYYQAVCGFSTVAIFAICQRALRRCREADSIFSFRRALTVSDADRFLDQDPVTCSYVGYAAPACHSFLRYNPNFVSSLVTSNNMKLTNHKQCTTISIILGAYDYHPLPPLPISLSATTTILPILTPILLFLARFLSNQSTTGANTPTFRNRFITSVISYLLTILPSGLATLALTYLFAPDLLVCQLNNQWQSYYHNKDSRAIRAIQDSLHCCGFRSVKDRAWPFKDRNHGDDACVRQIGYGRACLGPWEQEDKSAAWMVFWAAVLILVVKVFGWGEQIQIDLPGFLVQRTMRRVRSMEGRMETWVMIGLLISCRSRASRLMMMFGTDEGVVFAGCIESMLFGCDMTS